MTEPAPSSRKVVLSLYMSLDGVIENPAWTAPYWGDDISAFKEAENFESDLLLLGRVTYQGFAEAWPKMQDTGDFGNRMNTLPKVVATTTLETPEWNARFISGDIAQEVQRLKAQPGHNILIYGSGTFAQTLMAHGLIDEYRLLIYPVVLGTGQKFFSESSVPQSLVLSASQTFSSGVVALTYRPAEATNL
ncbi:dihydrofolate reductase family protein [Deinococcus sp. KNUC1210]|uniref:dihydrofolate reductase family protein n=1 Tax=Deinococcus sp. KNUC1210 TaxID=2917691 RepID=UPI001EF1157E|nr:dihydrofolate reductase family protein [Deinococcus sp. KNUC1210]ULH15832.1 dihydrofolate reductase family protein [Deinococcus sp. KNUC1210]